MSEFDGFAALSFDCYGTLIDWETGIADALAAWATGARVPASRDELLAAFAAAETAVQRRHPALPYPEVLARVLQRIGEHSSVPVTDEDAARFGASAAAWPAFPDSPNALTRLGERFRLVILSNVDRTSFAASNAKLGVDFDLVVTAEDVGAYKPDDLGFRLMFSRLEGLGVDRSRLLHVAQSLYHDHEPAHRLGLPSVWIDRRHDLAGHGATPPPQGEVTPRWRYPSLAAFADAALASG